MSGSNRLAVVDAARTANSHARATSSMDERSGLNIEPGIGEPLESVENKLSELVELVRAMSLATSQVRNNATQAVEAGAPVKFRDTPASAPEAAALADRMSQAELSRPDLAFTHDFDEQLARYINIGANGVFAPKALAPITAKVAQPAPLPDFSSSLRIVPPASAPASAGPIPVAAEFQDALSALRTLIQSRRPPSTEGLDADIEMKALEAELEQRALARETITTARIVDAPARPARAAARTPAPGADDNNAQARNRDQKIAEAAATQQADQVFLDAVRHLAQRNGYPSGLTGNMPASALAGGPAMSAPAVAVVASPPASARAAAASASEPVSAAPPSVSANAGPINENRDSGEVRRSFMDSVRRLAQERKPSASPSNAGTDETDAIDASRAQSMRLPSRANLQRPPVQLAGPMSAPPASDAQHRGEDRGVLRKNAGLLAGLCALLGVGWLAIAPKGGSDQVQDMRARVAALEAAVSRDEISALRKSITDARLDIDGLAVAMNAAISQINAKTDRFDRVLVERGDASRAAATPDKMVGAPKSVDGKFVAVAPPPGQGFNLSTPLYLGVDASPAAVTASIAPPVKAAKPRPPASSAVYYLREVYDGSAVVESSGGRRKVVIGDVLPGLGKVQSIEMRDRHWVVVTAGGVIAPQPN